MKKLFLVLLALPILCFSQMPANLLNTKSSKDIENVSKIIEESDTPLQYEYVSDDDIIFSFTTWEVIDLNQRVNFPLYFPTEIDLVTSDRRPLIHYLLRAIEDPMVGAQPYLDENFTTEMSKKDIERIRVYKRLKPGTDADGLTEGIEHFEEAGSWRKYLESIGYDFPEDEAWVNYDPLSDAFLELQRDGRNDEVKEYRDQWEAAASSIMGDENFNYQQLEYSDVRKYLIKGIWYFDKKATQLRYRPIALGPVATDAEEKFTLDADSSSNNQSSAYENDDFGGWDDGNDADEEVTDNFEAVEETTVSNDIGTTDDSLDDDREYRAMFWVFYPEVRDILHRAYAFNDKNMSKPISFDHLINSRRFSATVYKEANVYQDRDIRKYIGKNSLMQLLESQRIKEKIREREQDMWSY